MIRNFLSSVPFVLCSLLAPDSGAPAGGGGAQPGPFDSDNAPELTGETLEAKNSSALGLIKNLFSAGKDLVSRLATANNDRQRLEGQFNAAAADLTSEKEAHTKTKGELAAAKTQVLGLTTERDNANKNVERLEKLCNLRGIDPATIVPAATRPEGSSTSGGGNVWEQYQTLRQEEKSGKAKPGSAHAFYQKNSKALHEYQNSHKSE